MSVLLPVKRTHQRRSSSSCAPSLCAIVVGDALAEVDLTGVAQRRKLGSEGRTEEDYRSLRAKEPSR